jgi:hypothetical protein
MSKTKKNMGVPKQIPIISPSALKSTFLKRIKEHKNKSLAKQPTLADDLSDEFNDSMDYLKKLSDDREYKSKMDLKHNTSVKNYIPVYSGLNTNIPDVYLELDENLKEVPLSKMQPTCQTPSIRLKTSAEIPYSNLRVGGSKPTYREWTKTQKNISSPNQIVIDNNDINKQISERELRLNALKNKIKQKQEVKPVDVMQNIKIQTPMLEAPMLTVSEPIPIQSELTPITESIDNVKDTSSYVSKIITKTMRYTIGKSKMKQRVGVLLKDRGTRKNVLVAQKELKRKSMKDIKNYLKDHNLIKVGSNAPNDVLRQLFESAMMSGDIINKNKDNMLTNFMNNEQTV